MALGGTVIENLVVRLGGDLTGFQKMLKEAERAAKQTADKLGNIGKRMQSLGKQLSTRITVPLTIMAGVSVAAFAQFDQAMVESTSIMAVTEEQTKRMRDTALSLSGQVAQAPAELARSYFFLASAGLDAEQSLAALPQLTKFATAGAFDMALATDLLTDAQSALGLTSKDAAVNLTNMSRISDVLVKANTLANASVQQFSEALTNTAGAALRSMNKDVEEGVAVLAAFADQGIKANVAGTNLSRILRLLAKSARDNAKQHELLGFKVFDASGKMRNFADIIKNIEDITRGMSDETKSATLEMLGFEARVQQAILPLLGTSDAIRRYEKELRNAGGTTEDVADEQMKSFANQMKTLGNQIKAVGIELGAELAPALLKINDFIRSAIGLWQGLHPQIKSSAVALGAFMFFLGPGLSVIGRLIRFLPLAAGGFTILANALRVATAWMMRFNLATRRNIVGMLAFIATLVIGGILERFFDPFNRQMSDLIKNSKDFADEIEKNREEALRALGARGGTSGVRAMTDAQIANLKRSEEQTKKADEAFKELTTTLQKQIDTFGLSGAALARHEQDLTGLNRAQRAQVQSLNDTVDALEKQAKAQEEAARTAERLAAQGDAVRRQFFTPIERLIDRQSELRNLFNVGAIDRTTFDRAMKEAQTQFAKTQTPGVVGAANTVLAQREAVGIGSAEARQRLAEFQSKLRETGDDSKNLENIAGNTAEQKRLLEEGNQLDRELLEIFGPAALEG